jgi:2-amino-4-hydroxy-6-hydroxymethyldihydropteridine diphosphokinase
MRDAEQALHYRYNFCYKYNDYPQQNIYFLTMHYYLIGLGSNIQPEAHMPLACKAIAKHLKVVSYSPVLVNPPRGHTFNFPFHNQLLLIESPQPATELKALFEVIEMELGREPKSPERKFNDRPIDIDILHQDVDLTRLLSVSLEDPYNQEIMTQWPLETVLS